MQTKMIDAIGLSKAYRAIWANDLDKYAGFADLMQTDFLSHFDAESRSLLELSRDLSVYLADQRLMPFLHIDMQESLSLLPQETRNALTEFGYPLKKAGDGQRARKLKDTCLFQDADETQSHYGLRYISDFAATYLANRDIVDAGSYDGSSAKFFLNAYPVSRVFCFEPDPDNYALLQKNTTSEQDQKQLITTNKGLSNSCGLAMMSPSGVGTSRAKAKLESQPSITVETVTFDSFLTSFPDANIGLIKLDVEGDAVPALQGGIDSIRKHSPILIVSFYHTPSEFAETLPFLIDTFPAYEFKIRKVVPNLFKEHVIIGIPKSA